MNWFIKSSMLICSFLPLTGIADTPKDSAIPKEWVDARVKQATERLEKDEPGQLLLQTIEKHGGLSQWFLNGPLQFQFRYEPQGKGHVRDSVQVIDKWSSRARHKTKDGLEFGWDGNKAWSTQDSPYNPRFWSLTPYYFLAVPFVFADAGVNLEQLPNIKYYHLELQQIKITYDTGVGDSPDDYYIILIDSTTKRTVGVRYIVSYKGFFKDGGHSPEKVMFYNNYKEVEGIKLFTKAVSYPWNAAWDQNARIDLNNTKIAAKAQVGNIKFHRDLGASYFQVPDGAVIQSSM